MALDAGRRLSMQLLRETLQAAPMGRQERGCEELVTEMKGLLLEGTPFLGSSRHLQSFYVDSSQAVTVRR